VRKEVKQTYKQTIYTAPKSTHESQRITAPESIQGWSNGRFYNKIHKHLQQEALTNNPTA